MMERGRVGGTGRRVAAWLLVVLLCVDLASSSTISVVYGGPTPTDVDDFNSTSMCASGTLLRRCDCAFAVNRSSTGMVCDGTKMTPNPDGSMTCDALHSAAGYNNDSLVSRALCDTTPVYGNKEVQVALQYAVLVNATIYGAIKGTQAIATCSTGLQVVTCSCLSQFSYCSFGGFPLFAPVRWNSSTCVLEVSRNFSHPQHQSDTLFAELHAFCAVLPSTTASVCKDGETQSGLVCVGGEWFSLDPLSVLSSQGVVLNGSQYLSNLTLVNSSVLLPDRNVSIGQNLILQNSSLTLISPNTFINGSLSLQSSEVQLSNVLPTATAAPIVVGGCVNISSSTLQVNASSLSNGTTNIPVMSYGCRNGEFLDVQVIDQRDRCVKVDSHYSENILVLSLRLATLCSELESSDASMQQLTDLALLFGCIIALPHLL